eukprot:8059253-Alexandrium_andersonii.AAC.1
MLVQRCAARLQRTEQQALLGGRLLRRPTGSRTLAIPNGSRQNRHCDLGEMFTSIPAGVDSE